MILNAYAIYDTKVQQYGLPFFNHHHQLARRIVVEAANDDNTHLSKYPNDFVLFCIGTYDDTVGVLAHHAPENLGLVGAIVHQALGETIRRATSAFTPELAEDGAN